MKKDAQQTEAVRALWAKRRSLAASDALLGRSFLDLYKDDLAAISLSAGAPMGYIERQFLLHCPNYTLDELNGGALLSSGSRFSLLMLRRAIDYRLAQEPYEEKISLSKEEKMEERDLFKTDAIRVAPVHWDQARIIEDQLHYMQNYRSTAKRRLGLFYKWDTWPFCYTSVAVCDREYQHKAVCKALGVEISPRSIAILSRIYASSLAPRNSISFLVSKTMRILQEEGFLIYVTASNPFLGFSATSIAACNFVPFASSPVAYRYDKIGSYTTRRNSSDATEAKWSAPGNFLFMKSLAKPFAEQVRTLGDIVSVEKDSHDSVDGEFPIDPNDFQRTLLDLRVSLEGIWDENTRYHKTNYDPVSDPISKGQCGVTSAYLARLLKREGQEVLFCEGDVHFPDQAPILQHCWLRLVTPGGRKSDDIVIDITADQSGYHEKVICETQNSLVEMGIRYEEQYCVGHSEVGVEHVKNRLKILQNAIKKKHKDRFLN
ncbi:MAG: hypothetical protein AAFQ79_09150 [Pseudomonadota bacterium]